MSAPVSLLAPGREGIGRGGRIAMVLSDARGRLDAFSPRRGVVLTFRPRGGDVPPTSGAAIDRSSRWRAPEPFLCHFEITERQLHLGAHWDADLFHGATMPPGIAAVMRQDGATLTQCLSGERVAA